MVEGSCTFCIGTEKDITKFKWYGNPEGTFEMDDQKITLYKKSKVVKQAFGLIGSAMSGKGKYEAEITKEQIVGYKHDKKGSFWIDLNDSNKFYFCITGLGKKDKYDLVEKFLSDAVKMPGKTVANTNTNTVNNAPETTTLTNTGFNAVPPTQQAYTQQSVPPQPVYANPAPSPHDILLCEQTARRYLNLRLPCSPKVVPRSAHRHTDIHPALVFHAVPSSRRPPCRISHRFQYFLNISPPAPGQWLSPPLSCSHDFADNQAVHPHMAFCQFHAFQYKRSSVLFSVSGFPDSQILHPSVPGNEGSQTPQPDS